MKVTLRAARVSKGLSQAEAAKRAEIDRKTLSSYERGVRSPKVSILSRLVVVYGCELDDLIF